MRESRLGTTLVGQTAALPGPQSRLAPAVSNLPPRPTTRSASAQGFEYNIGLNPAQGLRIGLIGSYVDAELTQDAPDLASFKGQNLPFVPSFTNTLNVDYEWTLTGDWQASMGANWSHTGKKNGDLVSNPLFTNHPNIPSYDLVNAQIGVNNGRYSLQIFAKNLFNEQGVISYVSATGVDLTGRATYTTPRTIGARLSFKY
jgi:iron complex outermembrane recepter protein